MGEYVQSCLTLLFQQNILDRFNIVLILIFLFLLMKRTHSKQSLSLHRDPNIKDQLKSIENLQLTSENILQKLLNPAASQKKLTIDTKKYNPKFQKRDYQTLVQQNRSLKNQLTNQRHNVTELKFRLGEYQRKVKFLQGIQQKWQRTIKDDEQTKIHPVYTQILKKKIQQLNEMYLSSQKKIKQLKQLPHVSVFQESNIEKQYLMKETIRLKAIIAANSSTSAEDASIQNKFLKLMKEENQKLKSTIRLLENDKNLLKSRQILQKRQINDFKKEIEQLKATIITKQTQIQTQANQYKNMIFKKAQQFSNEQKKKQNQQYQNLKKNYDSLLESFKQLEIQKQGLVIECQKFKKSQKIYQNKKNNQDREKTQLRMQNTRLRKIIQDLREDLERQKQNARTIQNQNKKRRRQKKLLTNTPKVEQLSVVKFQQLELSLLILIYNLKNGTLPSIADLFIDEQGDIKCVKLIDIFMEDPLGLDRSEATKLARYIVQSNNSKTVIFNENLSATKELCITILKAAKNKFQECRSPINEDIWRCILVKSKKFIPQLQKMSDQAISKQAFLDLLGKHSYQSFGDYITYAILQSFDLQASQTEVMINTSALLELLQKILKTQSTR